MFHLIVSEYRTEQGLTLRDFAQALSERGETISHQTIANWENGTFLPSYRTFLPLVIHYRDWRLDFGYDCLAALKPDLFEPVGAIGRKLLSTLEV